MEADEQIAREKIRRESAGAETVLAILKPILEVGITALIKRMNEAAPELATLLDLRARLYWASKLIYEVEKMAESGKDLVEVLDVLREDE